MPEALLYFAYGSNMLPARLTERVGPCHCLGSVRLPGYRLAFHKRGRDGSGKCDLVADAAEESHGVVFRLDRDQKRRLDGFEGLGRGYRVEHLALHLDGTATTAFTYLAEPAWLDPGAIPFDWYRDLVLHGARHAGFPEPYCTAIAATPAGPDPDTGRAGRARALLDGVPQAASRPGRIKGNA